MTRVRVFVGRATSTARTNVITYDGRRTTVRAYPVSIEWPSRWACQSPPVERCRAAVRRELGLPLRTSGLSSASIAWTTPRASTRSVSPSSGSSSTRPRLARALRASCRSPSRAASVFPPIESSDLGCVATADRINLRFGTKDYRPIVLLEDAPRTGRCLPVPARRRRLLRRKPSRRHEPGREGIRQRTRR